MPIPPRATKSNGKCPAIDGIITYPDGRQLCDSTRRGREEYRARTLEMAERQNHICPWCKEPMSSPTFDHERGRGMGGAYRDDRILDEDGDWRNAAMHMACNGQKGSRAYCWRDGEYVYCGPGYAPTEDSLYAAEIGVRLALIQTLGGAAKLKRLDESARNLLLRQLPPSKNVGLNHHGYTSKVPGKYRVEKE